MTAGWSTRVGALVPSANAVFERDAARILPPHVSAHSARMDLTRDTAEQLERVIEDVPGAARLVADAGVAAIAFACTTGSLIAGPGYDRRIADLIEEAAGVPATTTSTAALEAFAALGASSVVLLAPYEPWLNAKVAAFLQAAGVEVLAEQGLGLPDPMDTDAVAPDRIARMARSLDRPGADAVFLSCTAFRGSEAARLVESELGKPVVSSNDATLWRLLQLAGADPSAATLGRLGEVAAR